ncbi:ribonuclease HII [Blastomonas sp.]|uniref:ribonuclease HII n=1 Tax=Blastomonas sp. TaxID=1909299 RepID=UPI0026065DFD|nr:ribonuclease HII [Blastomonas sp.]MDM7954860.1 ribonuclease HII [Blastomonas sp.]
MTRPGSLVSPEFPSSSAACGSVAGVDEAGRGPLAGPVVAAAVILCPDGITGLADSKVLSAGQRARLEAEIRAHCVFGIGVASVEEIDAINILQATMLAMTRAVEALRDAPGHVLVDGNRLPRWSYSAEAIVKGDALHPCISAASILAKQERDRMMQAAAAQHPHYGWERNMGYGTPEHLAALREHGPCALHRRSFAPVAQAMLL